jgi:hypothetical protein
MLQSFSTYSKAIGKAITLPINEATTEERKPLKIIGIPQGVKSKGVGYANPFKIVNEDFDDVSEIMMILEFVETKILRLQANDCYIGELIPIFGHLISVIKDLPTERTHARNLAKGLVQKLTVVSDFYKENKFAYAFASLDHRFWGKPWFTPRDAEIIHDVYKWVVGEIAAQKWDNMFNDYVKK